MVSLTDNVLANNLYLAIFYFIIEFYMNSSDCYYLKRDEEYFKYLEITGFSACSFIIGLILAKLCLR